MFGLFAVGCNGVEMCVRVFTDRDSMENYLTTIFGEPQQGQWWSDIASNYIGLVRFADLQGDLPYLTIRPIEFDRTLGYYAD